MFVEVKKDRGLFSVNRKKSNGDPRHLSDARTSGSYWNGGLFPEQEKGDIPIYVNQEHTLDSLRKLWDLSTVDSFDMFYPAWDKTYTCEEMRKRIREAENLIKWLDNAVQCVQKANPKADLRQIAQLVGEMV